jgi:ABC-type nitrate/sulfonate/bicarbonate transport system permease component
MADAPLTPAKLAGGQRRLATQLRVVAILGFLIVWQGLSISGLVYAGVLPSWTAIVTALARFSISPVFWSCLWVTILEIAASLAIGVAVGLFAGMALGMSGLAGRGLERYGQYVASTPKVVFLPLVFILFGIGSASKIALGAFACSFPVTLGIASAMRHLPPVYRSVARGFDLTAWQTARMVYLPALGRPILTALRVALGIAFSACLVAEMKFSSAGLGWLVVASYERSRFADVYALLTVIVGLAISATALLGRLETALTRRVPAASGSRL